MNFSVHVRCPCTGPDGKLLGQRCPQLWRRDDSWDARHGSAGFACRVPTSAGPRLVKRFGYKTKAEAKAAALHVAALLDAAGTDPAAQARAGGLVAERGKGGGRLPSIEDIQRRTAQGQDVSSGSGIDPGGFYVYLLWAVQGDDRPLYVGSTANLLQRLGAHLGNGGKRIHIGWVTYHRCASEQVMLRREGELIRRYQPLWNRRIPPELAEAEAGMSLQIAPEAQLTSP